MEEIKEYWKKIYEVRYFLWYMVKLELENKFRRSKLGILWTILNPFLLSVLMGVVFGVAFKMDVLTYMPYILSGILFWDMFSSGFGAGGLAIVSSGEFIRQCNYPMTLYTLKSALVYTITFLIAIFALLPWILVIYPQNIILGIVTLPVTVMIYFLVTWSATTIASYTNVQYRDYPMLIGLILQAIWYVSPVFFDENMFHGHRALTTWFNANPITHLLNLLRAPFLKGNIPSLEDYLISLAVVLLLAVWAWYINRKKERDVIFYL